MWLAVFISSSHLRTLGLEAGELVRDISPVLLLLVPIMVSLSIRSTKEAKSICLHEIHSNQVSPSKTPSYSRNYIEIGLILRPVKFWVRLTHVLWR
jgi:hypothetical protein